MLERKIIVAVIGGGEPTPDEVGVAEQVGREIARRGAILVCGGLGGVMEAACKGACLEGGMTIGILPGDSPRSANLYVQIPIVTSVGYARNIFVVKTAQAVIAVGGSYGTLSEIAYARQSDIPVIGLNTWQLARKGQPDDSIIPAGGPVEAVEKALSLANTRR